MLFRARNLLLAVSLLSCVSSHADILYVANTGNGTVQKFDLPTGAYLGSFATNGLTQPYGLAFDSATNLYVANGGNNTIEKFTPAGLGSLFTNTGVLKTPVGLFFDKTGNLYAANYGNDTIEKFTPGGVGTNFAVTGFNPFGMAFDSATNLYVANSGDNTIQKFTPAGVGSIFARTNLSSPAGLAFDAAGNLYVANENNNKIEKFSPTGTDLGTFANTGLTTPIGLVFDGAGNLYAANQGNNSIEKFSPTGTDLGAFINDAFNNYLSTPTFMFVKTGVSNNLSAAVVRISISPTNVAVPTSMTQQFTATEYFGNGSTVVVTNGGTNSFWSSSNPTVAVIDTNGLATALYSGNTTITATYGGVTASTKLTDIIPLSSFTNQWNPLTPLPDHGYSYQSLAYYNGFLYQTGGASTDNGFNDGINVFCSQVLTNGTIGAWKSATPMPEGVDEHASVAANGFLYVLGGYHSGDYGVYIANLVYYAKINPDGTLGSWQTNTPLPQPLLYLGATVWNNTIYVTGGSDGQLAYSNVYSATIQSNGTLSAWITQPSLPMPYYPFDGTYLGGVYGHGEVANGILYVLGGIIYGGQDYGNSVFYAKINPNGSLAGWNQTTPLPQGGNAYFGAVAAGGRILTIGGVDAIGNSGAISACYNAVVMGDGTLGVWSAGTSLLQPVAGEGIAVSGSYIFITGGQNYGGYPYLSTVYSTALPAPPAAPVLTKSNLVAGTFNLRLTSTQTNIGFGLRASTDLLDWTNISWGFTGTNGVLLLQDANAGQFPRRFYRAYWPLP